MKYKLIAIDLDGTLLNDEKVISSENIDTLKKLIDKNIEIVIATGRRYFAAKSFTKDLGDLVVISNNGNIARNTKNDRIILEKYINKEDFKYLLEEGKKINLHPILHANGYEEGFDFLIEDNEDNDSYNKYISEKETRYKKIDNFLKYDQDNIMVACYFGEYEVLNNFIEEIQRVYPNRFSYHIMTTLKKTGPILEVMNPLGSKWKSILEYAKYKNISKEEIITIGDDNNDMEMIKKSGLGIAMKNATQNVKKVSDIISRKDNNNSGVSIELKKIFDLK
ncbi:MAG: HAD family hydrolase [Senegalia sp. (in: firmicutes)]|uniref:HAD family hydrolase n=1 Tax=Senegalia sp. (in: firmicutes) TaxID=1924098 RepID=UPI003F9803F4